MAAPLHGANARTTVLLVDDHVLFRDGVAALLRAEDRVDIVGEAGDGVEALELMRAHPADVVVIDIDMPRLDGIAATEQILQEFPDTVVIVLSGAGRASDVEAARAAGASAYLAKDALLELGALLSASRM
jgi:DNA-binding NarL/FixJ family response regulator